MKSLYLALLLVPILLSPMSSFATLLLDEKTILDFSRKGLIPALEKSKIVSLTGELKNSSALEIYSPYLQLSGASNRTNEKALATFVPVTSKTEKLSAELIQKTKQGFSFSAGFNSYLFSNNFLQNGTTDGMGVKIVMDLNRDLFGRLSKNKLNETRLEESKGKLLADLNGKALIISLRKIYWRLVANAEATKVTNHLLLAAKEQAQEAQKKFRSGVADSGEVSRYQALIASRQAKLLSLKYQKEIGLRDLKSFIPEISMQEIELAPYDIEQTVQKVLACSSYIQQQSTPPLQNTAFDEIVALLNDIYNLQLKRSQLYNKWEVNLQGEYTKIGKARGRSDAFDNFQNSSQRSWGAALTLSIPLGKNKKTTSEILEDLAKKEVLASASENLAKIQAFHFQTHKSLNYLLEVISYQKINAKHLNDSLKNTKRKYNQARIGLNELISEQEIYFANELDTISTQLSIIDGILDYLAVFTETPCELNRI